MSKSQTNEITAEGIKATIITQGACLTSVTVNDRDGKPVDVVVGFDDLDEYKSSRSFNGAVIGRYGNRIKDGKFSIDGKSFQITKNEGGKTALHGGDDGYDRKVWEIVSKSDSSITLSHLDPAGGNGFPGAVQNYITYSVSPSPARLTVRIVALSLDEKTPIMPTTHTYWNLSGFKTPTVLEDTLHMPFASRSIAIDSINAPTGEFVEVKQSQNGRHLLDFTSPRRIGEFAPNDEFNKTSGPGIDHAFVFDESATPDAVKVQWSSPVTGIRLSLKTNQDGIQVYTATHHDGSAPVKKSQQGGESDKVQKFGCMAIEPQDYIDGVNHPEWKREKKQIFGPSDLPCVNWAEYAFDTI